MAGVLAAEVHAMLDQPPAAVSAMDGYAVRSQDGGPRKIVGAAPAGHPFAARWARARRVRIFTGRMWCPTAPTPS